MMSQRHLRFLRSLKARAWPFLLLAIVVLAVLTQPGCTALNASALIDRSSLLTELSAIRGLQEKRQLLDLLDDVCSSPASEVRTVFGPDWVTKYEALCPPPVGASP